MDPKSENIRAGWKKSKSSYLTARCSTNIYGTDGVRQRVRIFNAAYRGDSRSASKAFKRAHCDGSGNHSKSPKLAYGTREFRSDKILVANIGNLNDFGSSRTLGMFSPILSESQSEKWFPLRPEGLNKGTRKLCLEDRSLLLEDVRLAKAGDR